MIRNVTIIFLFLFSAAAHSQNIKWNAPIKIADRVHQTFLGSDGTYYYSVGSNINMIANPDDSLQAPILWKKLKLTLFRYDLKMTLKDTLPIRFGNVPRMYFATILSDKKIRLIYAYSTGDRLTCRSDNFDLTGKFIDTKNLDDVLNLPDFRVKKYFKVFLSPSKKSFAVVSKTGATAFDEKLEQLWKTENDFSNLSCGAFNESGILGAVVKKQNGSFAMSVNAKGKKSEMKISNSGTENEFYTIAQSNDSMYVASLYGRVNKTFNMDYGRAGNTVRFQSNGIQLNVFDNEMTGEKSSAIKFTDEVLLACTERLLLQNIEGIDWIKIVQLSIAENGDVILLLDYSYNEPTDSKPVQGSKIELPGHTYRGMQLVAVRITPDRKNAQQVIHHKITGPEQWDYVMKAAGVMSGNDYYLYFFEGRNQEEYTLSQVIFDNKMNKIFSKSIDLIAIKKPFPDLKTISDFAFKQKIIFARMAKKTATALLDFK